MENYGALEVIGEESEFDEDDTDTSQMFIRFKSENVNVSSSSVEGGVNYASGDINRDYCNSRKKTSNTNMNFPDLEKKRSSTATFDKRRSSSIARKNKSIIENTYRMEPNSDQYFVWYKVKVVLNKLIGPLFENYKYHSPTAGNFCKMICNKAITTVRRKYDWPRYRFVCHMTLIQLNNQGMIVADRSLMSQFTDNNAVCLFRNKEVVMIVTYHGLYYE